MTRKELLDNLQTAMVSEGASAVAIGNMVSTFTWSGLSDERRRQVMRQLEELSVGPERRAQRLKGLIAQIQGSSQDVF
jgi:hypothetical protein